MIGSTARHGLRFRVLRLSGMALLLLAAGCEDTVKDEFSITAREDRGSGGALEGLTVEGKGFTPNGTVLVTTVLSASGGNTRPYVEEQIQADGDGNFRYERRPPSCPQPVDYQRGSWTLVVARDMTSGISGSEQLDPGREPDCRGS